MNEHRIRADSFLLKKRGIRIYRVHIRDVGIVYWTKAEDALRYLNKLRAERLQPKRKGAGT